MGSVWRDGIRTCLHKPCEGHCGLHPSSPTSRHTYTEAHLLVVFSPWLDCPCLRLLPLSGTSPWRHDSTGAGQTGPHKPLPHSPAETGEEESARPVESFCFPPHPLHPPPTHTYTQKHKNTLQKNPRTRHPERYWHTQALSHCWQG